MMGHDEQKQEQLDRLRKQSVRKQLKGLIFFRGLQEKVSHHTVQFLHSCVEFW